MNNGKYCHCVAVLLIRKDIVHICSSSSFGSFRVPAISSVLVSSVNICSLGVQIQDMSFVQGRHVHCWPPCCPYVLQGTTACCSAHLSTITPCPELYKMQLFIISFDSVQNFMYQSSRSPGINGIFSFLVIHKASNRFLPCMMANSKTAYLSYLIKEKY